MPTANSTTPALSSNPVLPNDYAFKGYKLCIVTAGNTSPFVFKRWIPSEKWEFTPSGTAINDIISGGTPHLVGTKSDWTSALLEVVDGVSLKELSPTSTTYDTVNNVRAIVFKPTGKMATSVSGNRYVAVSESTYNGNALIATNPQNWLDIIIDQFTGRVTYGAE